MAEPATEQLFDLTPTDDQALAQNTARRFAQEELRSKSRSADEAALAPPGFYQKTMELGLNYGPIPESLGGIGAGRSPISGVLIAEDLGRGDMSLAIAALTPVSFINTLVDFGSAAQQAKYLPRFASDTFTAATVALMEPRARFEPSELQTTAQAVGDDYKLDGVKCMVPLGLSAEVMLVVAELKGQGPAAFIVERGAAGVTTQRNIHMGLRSLELATVNLAGVLVPKSAKLGETERPFDLTRLVDLSRLGTGALAVGVCDAVLQYAKEYCNERVAFGEPITNRQSVAFMIADIAIELDAMRLMVWRAAARASRGLPFHREAYLARVAVAQRGMEIGTNGIQLLGGHGFIREHLMELWYRNVRAAGILEGCAIV